MQKSPLNYLQAGFSLVEMILVVAIIAILLTAGAPPIFQMIQQRDATVEETRQEDIRKALEAYIAQNNNVPDDSITDVTNANFWANQLAPFTKLSAQEIREDVWRRDRRYIAFVDNSTRRIMGNAVEVTYVTILSSGPNGVATAATNIPVVNNAFAPPSNTGWWQSATNQIAAFSQLAAGDDDIMLRYTNYPEQLERYNLTMARLEKLSQAIERFARNGYAERMTLCSNSPRTANGTVSDPAIGPLCNNNAPENTIYYPRSTPVTTSVADNAGYAISTTIVNNRETDVNRRRDMRALVRLLGLSDEYCCSAIDFFADVENNGLQSQRPFFYFSNPRPRTGNSTCGTRPVTTATKLPARITTDYVADGAGNADNPSTCD